MAADAPVMDEMAWLASRLMIVTKSGDVRPFIPKPQQMRVLWVMARQRAAGYPIRLLILKGRQFGTSTLIQACFFSWTYHKSHRSALVVAHDGASTRHLFGMSQTFYAYLPEGEKRPLVASNVRELRYDLPHGSSIRAMTAGSGEKVGRSGTFQYVHVSELPFWDADQDTLTGILNTVPKPQETLDTAVIMEFTANGAGGEAYERWKAAEEKIERNPLDFSGYVPVFLSWKDEPLCRMPVPPGYRWEGAVDDEIAEDEPMLREMGFDDEQLYWRRYTIISEFNGNVDRFRAEFPATPSEAWIAGGTPAIGQSVITRHRRTVARPRWCRLEFVDGPDVRPPWKRRVRAEWLSACRDPCWWVWKSPEEDRDYIIGGDSMKGISSDPSAQDAERDWHGGEVLDRVGVEQAAEWRGQMDTDLFAEELFKAAIWYKLAFIAPEANDTGLVVVLYLKRKQYPRIYQREGRRDEWELDRTDRLGFSTTGPSRNVLIDQFLEFARPPADPVVPVSEWEGKLILHSARLVGEMETFIYNKKGKREHRRGTHDDLLFGMMLALEGHVKCARTLSAIRAVALRKDLRIPGAVDTFEDLEQELCPSLR